MVRIMSNPNKLDGTFKAIMIGAVCFFIYVPANELHKHVHAMHVAEEQRQHQAAEDLAKIKELQTQADILQKEVEELGKVAAQKTAFQNSLTCLANNIYYESATEPVEGQIAVAQVTMNRVHDRTFDGTVCGVVYFKKVNPNTGKKEAAFSWTLGSKWRAKGMNHKIYEHCKAIAHAFLTKRMRSDIIGANVEYYHADYISPGWNRQVVAHIGHHIFYQ